MHLCAAKCCQDSTSSVDSVQRCVDRCSAPMTKAQNYVQYELGEFQGRLQRCVMVSIWKHVWLLDFTLPHLTSTAMQRRCQSKNAAKPQRGANCQIHRSIRTLRDSVRRQTRWTDTQPYEDYEDGPCQGSRLNTSTLVELILALHLSQFYTLTLICCWSGWKINLYTYIVIIT